MTERPASPAQLRFIRDLLAARPSVLAQYGFATPEAAVEALAANPAFTTRAASGMIDQLKALPVEPVQVAGVALPQGAKANRYAGKCHTCKATVDAEAGYFLRSATGKVLVYHVACPTPAAAPAAPAPSTPAVVVNDGDLYVNDDGVIRRVYTTQNGNLAAKRLSLHADGVGGFTGSLRYEVGGLRSLRDDIAAGKAHPVSQAEAAAFGEQYGVCSNCGLDINDDRSLAAGYGPVCAQNHGWFYPTYEQAASILGRSVTKPSGVVVTPEGATTAADDSHAAHDATEADAALVEAPPVPTCEDCGQVLADVAGEPCLQGTPDWRGEYPVHPLPFGLLPTDDDDDTEPF